MSLNPWVQMLQTLQSFRPHGPPFFFRPRQNMVEQQRAVHVCKGKIIEQEEEELKITAKTGHRYMAYYTSTIPP